MFYKRSVVMVAVLLAASAGAAAAQKKPKMENHKKIYKMSAAQLKAVPNLDFCHALDKMTTIYPMVQLEIDDRKIDCFRIMYLGGVEPKGRVLQEFNEAEVVSIAPSLVATIAARELAKMSYQITTSDISNGLVVAHRIGTPMELPGQIDCRYNTFAPTSNGTKLDGGKVQHTVTVTAQSKPNGTSFDVSGTTALIGVQPQFQECKPNGYVERTIREAIRSGK